MYIQSKMKTKQSPAPIRAARWTLEFFKQLSYNTDLKAYAYASTETGFVGIEYYLQGFFLKIQWYVAVPSRLDIVVTCCHLSANSLGRQLCRQFFTLSVLHSGVEERKGNKYSVWGQNLAATCSLALF